MMDNTYIDDDIFLMNFLLVLSKKIKRYFDMKLLEIFIFLQKHFQVMSSLDCWGLDVFHVSDLSEEKPLTVTTYTIFQV